VTISPAAIAAAYREACLAELDAPKPGNVHKYAAGHQMTVADFVRAARASADAIAQHGARVGARIRAAVAATQAAVGVNANLGIILLAAPLAAAAEAPSDDLRARLVAVLDGLDAADAADAFVAIAAARPGGLGRVARHDVNEPAETTLLRAMAEAADRDSIARQYASGFEDVFTLGLPVLVAARARHAEPRWATLAVYLAYLAAFPDTHIARKFDAATADAVREEARVWRLRFDAASDATGLLAELLAWDGALKARRLNPGASADLTVATLFADSLSQRAPGRLALKPQQ
jgi:triphosphoribosyl-dephospho-CoA synthase